MKPEIIPILPDTPMSVLELFSTSKEKNIQFANAIIDDVKGGVSDPLRVLVLAKSIISIMESVIDNTKTEQANAAEKYGRGPFEVAGATMEVVPVKTEYDYSVCNHPKLKEYERNLAMAKADLDVLKAHLKTTYEIGYHFVDPDSGEFFHVLPPIKKQTMGVKVTIK